VLFCFPSLEIRRKGKKTLEGQADRIAQASGCFEQHAVDISDAARVCSAGLPKVRSGRRFIGTLRMRVSGDHHGDLMGNPLADVSPDAPSVPSD
jgi:hypothetical protein